MSFSNVRLKSIEFAVRFTPRSRCFSSHNHHHIIGLQLSGTYNHTFTDRHFTIEEDCIYFLNQAEAYNVEVETVGSCLSIHFTTYEPIHTPSFCIKLQDTRQVLNLLENLEQHDREGTFASARSISDFYRLLNLYEDIFSKKYHPNSATIADARRELLTRFREKGCIDAAAAQCGLSRRRFNDLFKEQFSTTPHRLILDHKLALAKKMLTETDFSIEEIAAHCGCCDVYHFNKLFKKETGQTPGLYRKNRLLQ